MTEINIAPENREATEAWNGPLFDIWQSSAIRPSSWLGWWGRKATPTAST